MSRWDRGMSVRFYRVVAALCAVVLTVTLTEAPAAAKSLSVAAGPSHAQLPSHAKLQSLMDELVINGMPGVLTTVDDGPGPAWKGASGAASLNPRVPLRPSARFRVGSITKSMVATVVLQLVGEGTLRLDDSVERWLPGMVPAGDSISVRQLLNHTSGIFNYTDDPAFVADLVGKPAQYIPPERLVAIATAHPPLFPPGGGWSYSNTNYILAGLIIEAATGRTAKAQLTKRIFAPLGLRNTSFPVVDRRISGYHAHGYLLPGNPIFPTAQPLDVTDLVSPSGAWTAGAVISTADDLSRFYGALLGGRLLPPALLQQMLTTVQVDPVVGYGLGVFSIRTVCGTIWGHNGGVPGYNSFASNSRDGKRNLVMMVSAEPDTQTGPLVDLALNTATCNMFGQNVNDHALANTAPLLSNKALKSMLN